MDCGPVTLDCELAWRTPLRVARSLVRAGLEEQVDALTMAACRRPMQRRAVAVSVDRVNVVAKVEKLPDLRQLVGGHAQREALDLSRHLLRVLVMHHAGERS